VSLYIDIWPDSDFLPGNINLLDQCAFEYYSIQKCKKRINSMRTTIEVSDRHRIILLSLSAQRGLRGYSGIIQEALDYYIEHQIRN
jgi:hypothetical protein